MSQMEQLFLSGNLFDRIDELERRVRAAERRTSELGSRLLLDGWRRTDVAASLSAVAVNRFAESADSGLIMPVSFAIRGLLVSLNAARTAGTLAAVVYVAGSATALQADFNAENTQYAYVTSTTITADRGEVVDIRLTSDGSWAPTTADLWAALIVEIL